MIAIAPLTPADRAEWEMLARGYKDFYEDPIPDAAYDRTWQRLMAGEVHGLGARIDGKLVGIAHYLFHAHSWNGRACYLQDLFTVPEARGRGIARTLIDAIGDRATAESAASFYWVTKENNAPARALYDKVARYKGFIRYDYPLQ